MKILTPTVPIDLAVRPRGYRRALLENVTGRSELVLEPPMRVWLVLRTDGEFPELPYVFSATCARTTWMWEILDGCGYGSCQRF